MERTSQEEQGWFFSLCLSLAQKENIGGEKVGDVLLTSIFPGAESQKKKKVRVLGVKRKDAILPQRVRGEVEGWEQVYC